MDDPAMESRPMRLNRYLAACGLGSRRNCERLIIEGHVSVNDMPVTDLASVVIPGKDAVCVDGETMRIPTAHVYIMMNKPKGFITTMRDPENRRSVAFLLPHTARRVFPVGRLDKDSEGLLVFTSDGMTANGLAHPRFGIERFYHVTVSPPFPRNRLRELERGINIGGEKLSVHAASLEGKHATGRQLNLILRTGKKREIRRLLEAYGFQVRRILRYGFGPLRLGSLSPGRTRPLTGPEISSLLSLEHETLKTTGLPVPRMFHGISFYPGCS